MTPKVIKYTVRKFINSPVVTGTLRSSQGSRAQVTSDLASLLCCSYAIRCFPSTLRNLFPSFVGPLRVVKILLGCSDFKASLERSVNKRDLQKGIWPCKCWATFNSKGRYFTVNKHEYISDMSVKWLRHFMVTDKTVQIMNEVYSLRGPAGSVKQTSNAWPWGGGTGLSGTEMTNYTLARHSTCTNTWESFALDFRFMLNSFGCSETLTSSLNENFFVLLVLKCIELRSWRSNI